MESTGPKPPTAHTLRRNAAFAPQLDPADQHDQVNAQRGLVAPVPNDGVVTNKRGTKVWDLNNYAFLEDADTGDAINPSLLRMAKLNMAAGLFEVCERVYQVRGMDLANMTIIETNTGLVLVDCLTTVEVAGAALDLYYAHRPYKPVKALIYTHSHVDHYGGAKGVLDEASVAAGAAKVIAPAGFLEAVGGENVLAGNAMARRAQFQFGGLLKTGARGQIDAGLGKVTARGTVSLIAPTHTICKPLEVHVIDGLTIEFHLAPGTEAPAEMHMFFPDLGVLNMAENATPLLHNFCPLRGSEVRDPRIWSYYLADAVRRFGARTEVLICQHHWPTWGREQVIDFLCRQRDLYKHIHDQTVRLMNHGYRPSEIAEVLDIPPSLQNDWRMRGYYGTVSHNSKAVFQRYLSWYDGHPANLNPLPPREAGPRYVSYMGGAAALLEKAQADFDAGEYRWVAQVLYHLLFAEPDNERGRSLAADAFDQLGYQAESATWRNAYLYAAQELREGVIKLPPRPILSPDLLGAVATDTLFDFVSVRLAAERAEGKQYVFNWHLTDRDEHICQTLSNETLTHLAGETAATADATIRLARATLVDLVVKRTSVTDAVTAGSIEVAGSAKAVGELFDLLDDFDLQFPIVTPE